VNIPHPSELLLEEIEERGWTLDRFAVEMGGDAALNRLALDMWIAVKSPKCLLGDMSEQFSQAFGVSPGFFARLEQRWIAAYEEQPKDGEKA
jgi:plasmid maintenance system antidote protein VapI